RGRAGPARRSGRRRGRRGRDRSRGLLAVAVVQARWQAGRPQSLDRLARLDDVLVGLAAVAHRLLRRLVQLIDQQLVARLVAGPLDLFVELDPQHAAAHALEDRDFATGALADEVLLHHP